MVDNVYNYNMQPLTPLDSRRTSDTKQSIGKQPAQGQSFSSLLQNELTEVKFSQHAAQRMSMRNLNIEQADMIKLDNAIDMMAQKGARESLVLLNDIALVVSVKNRTVITAMDGKSVKDNIFTNIDSAVIL